MKKERKENRYLHPFDRLNPPFEILNVNLNY